MTNIKNFIGKLSMPPDMNERDQTTLDLMVIKQAHEHIYTDRRLDELGYFGWREDGMLKVLTFEECDDRAVIASWRMVPGSYGSTGLECVGEHYVPRDMAINTVIGDITAHCKGVIRQKALRPFYANWLLAGFGKQTQH